MSQLNSIAKGRCLCGAVSIATTEINHHVSACHCSTCRKWGGGALFGVECEGEVSFSGEENISIYQSSEWAERGFCKQCGSHLFYKLKDKNHYFIPAGIFNQDENEKFVFDLQVFIEEKPKYYAFANDTKKMTGSELFSWFESASEK
ncbi:MAG: GFA family protein [Microcoleaceae cyanobacterium]